MEFVRQLAYQQNVFVIATCRNPANAKELNSLGGNVSVQQLDVLNEDEIKRTSEFVKSEFGRLDFLLNSSAMLHPSGKYV